MKKSGEAGFFSFLQGPNYPRRSLEYLGPCKMKKFFTKFLHSFSCIGSPLVDHEVIPEGDDGLQMTDDGWGLLESTNDEVRSTLRVLSFVDDRCADALSILCDIAVK